MLIQIQTLRVFLETTIKLQWQHLLLSFHLLGLYPGIFIRFSIHFINSRQYSSLDDALPHCFPLCTKIYNPQQLTQDEHYGNC
jgi:hypothetical protein